MARTAFSTPKISATSNSNSKRKKLSNGVDRISSLPESLLSRILSLLPTKDAVATSVLSTRWKFLWTSITNLGFVDVDEVPWLIPKKTLKDKKKKLNFINFVNRVMLLLNPLCIHRFDLQCNLVSDIFHFNTWICAALGRNVREIVLDLPVCRVNPLELPRSLFSCNTLEILRLNDGIVFNIPASGSVSLPNLKILHLVSTSCANMVGAGSTCFPNLKVIRLIHVRYLNDDCVSKLVTSCPVLEDLVIRGTDALSSIIICAPALRRVEMNCTTKIFPRGGGRRVQIDAPALEYLNLRDGYMPEDFLMENLFSLVEAKIYICNRNVYVPQDIHDGSGNAVLKLIRGLSHVKCLFLSENTVKAFSNEFPCIAPVFCNLTRLELEISCCDWRVLGSVLRNSDNLEHVICTKGYQQCGSNGSWGEPEYVPKCLLFCLTTILISNSCGCTDELDLVRYILKNANVLETMEILNSRCNDDSERFELLQKISMFPRGSKICEVAFS